MTKPRERSPEIPKTQVFDSEEIFQLRRFQVVIDEAMGIVQSGQVDPVHAAGLAEIARQSPEFQEPLRVSRINFTWMLLQAFREGMFTISGPVAQMLGISPDEFNKFSDYVLEIRLQALDFRIRSMEMGGKKINKGRQLLYKEFEVILAEQEGRGEEENHAQGSRIMATRHGWSKKQRANFVRAYQKLRSSDRTNFS